jgi:DNA-binding NtrC family response regulator
MMLFMTPDRSALIVDPNTLNGAAAKRVLEAAGFRVCLVTTFGEAKKLLAMEHPDVLVTNLRLGAYNGLDLVLRSRAYQPKCAAIVTTEFPDQVLQAEAERQHASFLVRPFDDSELLNSINQRSLGES